QEAARLRQVLRLRGGPHPRAARRAPSGRRGDRGRALPRRGRHGRRLRATVTSRPAGEALLIGRVLVTVLLVVHALGRRVDGEDGALAGEHVRIGCRPLARLEPLAAVDLEDAAHAVLADLVLAPVLRVPEDL